MKTSNVVTILLVVIVMSALQTSAVAGKEHKDLPLQPPATIIQADITYQTESCDPDAMGEKIKEKAKTLSDNVCATSEIVNEDDTGFFTQGKKDFFAKQCDKTKEMVNDPSYASNIASMGKGNKDSSCYVIEIDADDDIGDDDGICTQNEKIKGGCQEAVEGENGDGDGICEEIKQTVDEKGKKIKTWETCEEVCIVTEADVSDSCNKLEAMDGLLEDTNEELANLNVQTTLRLQDLSQQQELANQIEDTVVQTDMSACNNVLRVNIAGSWYQGTWFGYADVGRPDTFDNTAWLYHAVEVADLAANACDDWTASIDPDGPGPAGHPQFVCAWAHLVKSIASEISNLSSMLDDAITAARIDNMAACLQQVGQSNAKLEETNANLEEKLDEIIRLLNTPAGRRDTFPIK